MGGRVVVLGSVNVDLTVETPRLPKAGETVVGSRLTWSHGGKGANQAVAAARAGADVWLCGAVGTDSSGGEALEALVAEGVNVDRVARVDGSTGTAVVVVAEGGENEILVVPGANLLAHGEGVGWRRGDVAAAVLEVPIDSVGGFLAEARSAGATTLLNAAPASPEAAAAGLLELADVICVNEVEMGMLGLGPDTGLPGGAALVLTLGRGGIRVVDGDGRLDIPGHAVTAVATVGAGDAVCGVLAAGLAEGRPLRESVVRANAAGALAVQAAGARSSPALAELEAFLESGN